MKTQQSKSGERFGLVLTNATKLAGIIVAVHEALLVEHVRAAVLGIAALMMAGAQSLESSLVAFFGGPLAKQQQSEEDKK